MQANWITPQLGSIILLKTGFDTTSENHYGLVLGAFKLAGSHDRNLLIAPGTSLKSGYQPNITRDLLITPTDAAIGRSTVFYLSSNLIKLELYPSDEILESNRPTAQADQKSTEVSVINDLKTKLRRFEIDSGKTLDATIEDALKAFGISKSQTTAISPKRPDSWLSSAQT